MSDFNMPPGVLAADIPGQDDDKGWAEEGDMQAVAVMTLRDVFAALAHGCDIDAQRAFVPRTTAIRTTSDGRKYVTHHVEPDNWMAIARYLHADEMLKAMSQ